MLVVPARVDVVAYVASSTDLRSFLPPYPRVALAAGLLRNLQLWREPRVLRKMSPGIPLLLLVRTNRWPLVQGAWAPRATTLSAFCVLLQRVSLRGGDRVPLPTPYYTTHLVLSVVHGPCQPS